MCQVRAEWQIMLNTVRVFCAELTLHTEICPDQSMELNDQGPLLVMSPTSGQRVKLLFKWNNFLNSTCDILQLQPASADALQNKTEWDSLGRDRWAWVWFNVDGIQSHILLSFMGMGGACPQNVQLQGIGALKQAEHLIFQWRWWEVKSRHGLNTQRDLWTSPSSSVAVKLWCSVYQAHSCSWPSVVWLSCN